jgi:hypothetical protein
MLQLHVDNLNAMKKAADALMVPATRKGKVGSGEPHRIPALGGTAVPSPGLSNKH